MKRILTLIGLCLLNSQLKAQVSFAPATNYFTGGGPSWVAAADVNGDGKPDLITANTTSNTLSVLTNNGSGDFVLASTLEVGVGPGCVIAADVNNDGWMDLVCANGGTNTLSVLTNDGSGGFVLGSTLEVGSNPYSVVAADVNGDGWVDLISANNGSNTLSVFTNNGSGGFVLASTLEVGSGPNTVVAADVNGDGWIDLICANYGSSTLSVLTNNGNGGFALASSPSVGTNPYGCVAADVNGDGWVDLISANYAGGGGNTLTILTNNGSGSFVLSSSPVVNPAPLGVIAADVNGDGKPDLICPNYGFQNGNTLTILTNNGTGGFVLASTPSVGTGPDSVIAADVNGDAKPDLISANHFGNTISVLLNTTPTQDFLNNGLVAYYPFTNNANDASGNGLNASVQGNYQYLSDGTLQLIGDGALFYSGGGYVALPNYGNLNSGFTVSLWVKGETDQGDGIYAEYYLWFDNDVNSIVYMGQYDFAVQAGTAVADFPYTVSNWSQFRASWQQLLLAYSPTNCTAYLNGIIIGSTNITANAWPMVNAAVGHHWWNQPGDANSSSRMTFDVKDFRIYSRALCSNEVAQLYAYESQATNPPSFTDQPQSFLVNAHDTASFSVTATGAEPLSYQWSLDGTNISGATNSTLTISNVSQTDLGVYAVIVANAFGSVTSSNATLAMYPFLTEPFGGDVTDWGQNATLSVQAWGTGPLSFQWYDDGVAILNATNQTLDLSSIQFTNAGLYSVVVSSPLGSVTNTPAQVVVNVAGVSLGFSPTLTIAGVPGFTYTIQSTTNLENTNAWITLTNMTLTQPVQLFIDTTVDASSPFNAQHFYKILPGQ